MKIFKIYVLIHPLSNEIRYVGVTSRKLHERLYQHSWNSRSINSSGYHLPVSKWIRSLIKVDLKPIISLIEEVNELNWEEKEIYYINLYSKSSKLLNISKGGRGLIVGKTREMANKNSIESHKKKICQFDIDNNLIKVWDSLTEVSLFFNAKSKSSVSNAANLKYRAITAFGFKWQYYSDYIKKVKLKECKLEENIKRNNKGLIYMFNSDNILIKTFKITQEAADFLGVYSSAISDSINHNRKCYNFYFSRNINFKI